MRILIVTEDVPAVMLGGAGQHAVVLGNALIDAGHEVHMLGYRRPENVQGNCGFRGPLITSIDFSHARWQDRRFGFFNPFARPHMARRLWQAMRDQKGPWDVVHYHGHNALLGKRVPSSWNFVQTLHDQGAECITWSRFRQGEPCRETSAKACAGCAADKPNLMQAWLSTRAAHDLRRGSLDAFRRHPVVFVSEFVRRRYCESLGVAASEIRSAVVHNFVDAHKLRAAMAAPPADWPVVAGRVRVFAAGRIDRAKGFSAFLNALDDDLILRVDLVIAGDGPELAGLRQQHAARGVRFLGWCPPETVLAWTRAAEVCVVPSIWEEPCATTVLEALALGRPVLALRRGGTPELVKHGQPGQLRLFEDLATLVRSLHPDAAANAFVPVPTSESAVVERRLPELIAVYAKNAARLTGDKEVS
jgi:glycogen(starch) synthase